MASEIQILLFDQAKDIPIFIGTTRGSNPLGDASIIIEEPRHRSGLFFFISRALFNS